MVGAPGEQRVATRLPSGHDGLPSIDDTTSAQLGPPTAARAAEPTADDLVSDDDDEDEPEEHTVQQAMPPAVAAAAAAAAAKPRIPVVPSRPPSQPTHTPAAAAPSSSRPKADVEEDDEPLEDSITATAPRLNSANLMDAAISGRGVPVTVPGRVEIRTLEDDDDDAGIKTEVRSRPDLPPPPADVPVTLRASGPPAPRPAAGRPPEAAPPIEPELDPDGPDDDGVTTQAVAPRVGSVPDIGASLLASAKPSADAAVHSAIAPTLASSNLATAKADDEEGDELLTRPGLGGELEPPTRPGVEGATEPPTRPGLEPPTGKVERKADPGYANDQDDDASVTSRAPNLEPYGDDSVTTQAPNVPIELIHAAIKSADAVSDGSLDDTSAATTQKVKKPVRPGAASPADEEAESITTQAPGHVTNMLRVIASGSSPELDKGKGALPIEDEDEGPENRTAVMANAPLKRIIQEVDSSSRLPAIRPTGGPLVHGPMGAAAPRLEPSSESGLRVARSGSGSDERASLGQLMAAGDARGSLGLPAASPMSEGMMSAASDGRGHDMGPMHVQPSLHDVDLGKGPRYGLLVAVVAVISFVVPVTLFVVLRRGSEPVTQETPSEPVSEVAKPSTAARGKAPRGRNGLTIVPSAAASAPPSAAPSSSASGKPGAKTPPFGRR